MRRGQSETEAAYRVRNAAWAPVALAAVLLVVSTVVGLVAAGLAIVGAHAIGAREARAAALFLFVLAIVLLIVGVDGVL